MIFNAAIRQALWLIGIVLIAANFTTAVAQGAEERVPQVALDYYRALAEGGLADAQLVLGDIYRSGDGVPANLIEAYAWYYLAAQQGVEEAIKPMNEVLLALPELQWPKAKKLAEDYERRFIPQKQ